MRHKLRGMLPVAIASWGYVLGVVTLLLWAFALADVIGRRPDLERRQRSAWILVIVLLPIVGSIYYLVQRSR